MTFSGQLAPRSPGAVTCLFPRSGDGGCYFSDIDIDIEWKYVFKET